MLLFLVSFLLFSSTADAEKKVENLSRLLKEEKQVKKQLEGRLSNLEEEMADLKAEKEAVEKVNIVIKFIKPLRKLTKM